MKPLSNKVCPKPHTNRVRQDRFKYVFRKPSVREFACLFQTTGWQRFPDRVLKKAIDGTYCELCVYQGRRLVGTARILSDGAMYAWINDMIVHPTVRHQGIGSRILSLIKRHLRQQKIPTVGLFCARTAKKFYLQSGFKERPPDAPGMYVDLSRKYRSL